MVYLYLCAACEAGLHNKCDIGFPCPPGQFGGSQCKCLNLECQEIKKMKFEQQNRKDKMEEKKENESNMTPQLPQIKKGGYTPPGALEVLIHCHVQPHAEHPRSKTPTVVNALEWYYTHGYIEPRKEDGVTKCLIQDCDGRYGTTEKGRAWMMAFCETPCPSLTPTPIQSEERKESVETKSKVDRSAIPQPN